MKQKLAGVIVCLALCAPTVSWSMHKSADARQRRQETEEGARKNKSVGLGVVNWIKKVPTPVKIIVATSAAVAFGLMLNSYLHRDETIAAQKRAAFSEIVETIRSYFKNNPERNKYKMAERCDCVWGRFWYLQAHADRKDKALVVTARDEANKRIAVALPIDPNVQKMTS